MQCFDYNKGNEKKLLKPRFVFQGNQIYIIKAMLKWKIDGLLQY